MPLYETTFVARQDISAQDVKRLTQEVSDIVTSNGGKIVKKEYWGLRNIAYKIKKNRKGHYTMLGIEAPANAIEELNRKYHINEDIIRDLTVRVENLDKNPSPMMQSDEAGAKGGKND